MVGATGRGYGLGGAMINTHQPVSTNLSSAELMKEINHLHAYAKLDKVRKIRTKGTLAEIKLAEERLSVLYSLLSKRLDEELHPHMAPPDSSVYYYSRPSDLEVAYHFYQDKASGRKVPAHNPNMDPFTRYHRVYMGNYNY